MERHLIFFLISKYYRTPFRCVLVSGFYTLNNNRFQFSRLGVLSMEKKKKNILATNKVNPNAIGSHFVADFMLAVFFK